MRIDGAPGKFGFRAIYDYHGMWELTEGVFFTAEEAKNYFVNKVPCNYMWPITYCEINGCYYIPTEDEIKEMQNG